VGGTLGRCLLADLREPGDGPSARAGQGFDDVQEVMSPGIAGSLIAWRCTLRAAMIRGEPTVTAGAADIGLAADGDTRVSATPDLRNHRADSKPSMVDPGRSSYRTCRIAGVAARMLMH